MLRPAFHLDGLFFSFLASENRYVPFLDAKKLGQKLHQMLVGLAVDGRSRHAYPDDGADTAHHFRMLSVGNDTNTNDHIAFLFINEIFRLSSRERCAARVMACSNRFFILD